MRPHYGSRGRRLGGSKRGRDDELRREFQRKQRRKTVHQRESEKKKKKAAAAAPAKKVRFKRTRSPDKSRGPKRAKASPPEPKKPAPRSAMTRQVKQEFLEKTGEWTPRRAGGSLKDRRRQARPTGQGDSVADFGREQAGKRREKYMARRFSKAAREVKLTRRRANARSRIQQHASAGLGQPKDSSVSFEEELLRQAPPEKGLRLRGGANEPPSDPRLQSGDTSDARHAQITADIASTPIQVRDTSAISIDRDADVTEEPVDVATMPPLEDEPNPTGAREPPRMTAVESPQPVPPDLPTLDTADNPVDEPPTEPPPTEPVEEPPAPQMTSSMADEPIQTNPWDTADVIQDVVGPDPVEPHISSADAGASALLNRINANHPDTQAQGDLSQALALRTQRQAAARAADVPDPQMPTQPGGSLPSAAMQAQMDADSQAANLATFAHISALNNLPMPSGVSTMNTAVPPLPPQPTSRPAPTGSNASNFGMGRPGSRTQPIDLRPGGRQAPIDLTRMRPSVDLTRPGFQADPIEVKADTDVSMPDAPPKITLPDDWGKPKPDYMLPDKWPPEPPKMDVDSPVKPPRLHAASHSAFAPEIKPPDRPPLQAASGSAFEPVKDEPMPDPGFQQPQLHEASAAANQPMPEVDMPPDPDEPPPPPSPRGGAMVPYRGDRREGREPYGRGGGRFGQLSGQQGGQQAQQQAPIVVMGGQGAAATAAAAPRGGGGVAVAPQIIVQKAKAKPKKKKQSGITQARKRYTAKRKAKLAELRSQKAKKVKEFNSRTKKMPKAARDKARREFKAKVNAQFKQLSKRFPTARGVQDTRALATMTKQLDTL